MRVLLVEDDITAARGIVGVLKAAAMIVDTADTGEEALELAKLYDYDIIVLDLGCPTWRATRSSAACAPPGSRRRC